MIHGELTGREGTAAMMADAGGPLALPPLGGAKIAGFPALAPDVFFRDLDEEGRHRRDDAGDDRALQRRAQR